MRQWIFKQYLRWGVKSAYCRDKYRLLQDWCDYGAHRRVKWIAIVNGRKWGQSCTKHSAALAIDAMREGNAFIKPVENKSPGPA